MKAHYQSKEKHQHIRTEEIQWAEILSSGHPFVGMIMVHDQKLCAIVHEIEAAINEGKIDVEHVPFYAKRLKIRVDKVLELLNDSEHNFKVRDSLVEIRSKLEGLTSNENSYNILKDIPKIIHEISHKVCDELYEIIQ